MQKDDDEGPFSRAWIGVDPGNGGSCVVCDPPWDYSAEHSHYEGQVFKSLGLPRRVLDPKPEPEPPSAEALVEVLREHPELCAKVKRLLDEDHEHRERIREVLDWQNGGWSNIRPRGQSLSDKLFNFAAHAGSGKTTIQADLSSIEMRSSHPDMIDALRYAMWASNGMFNKAVDLWAEYDKVTEQYDRSVCSGVSPRSGEAMPTTPQERSLSARFAAQQWRKLRDKASQQGIPASVVQEAKGSKARDQLHREMLAKLGRFNPARGRVQPPAPKKRRRR